MNCTDNTIIIQLSIYRYFKIKNQRLSQFIHLNNNCHIKPITYI